MQTGLAQIVTPLQPQLLRMNRWRNQAPMPHHGDEAVQAPMAGQRRQEQEVAARSLRETALPLDALSAQSFWPRLLLVDSLLANRGNCAS